MALARVKSEPVENISTKPTPKTGLEKFIPVMVVLMMVMSFYLGNLSSKVKYLESGNGKNTNTQPAAQGNQAAPAGKYTTLSQAITAYAKASGLDSNKLIKCMESGEKAAAVKGDYDQGVSVGVQGTPAFFINGRFLGGAFPFDSFKEIIDRELNGTGSNNYQDYTDTNLKSAGAMNPPAFIAKPATVEVGKAAIKGGNNAKVTVVEFSDYQCPYCSRVQDTIKQLVSAYGDKVKLVFKNFPLSQIHPLAQKTAEAWECAKDQGTDKAWKFHDALFVNQGEWSGTTL